MKIVTFLSDFGTVDGYVAAMKGVVLAACPAAQVMDATHEIPPQDIRSGAWALRNYWRLFPPGSIHVAVVDPGVGSARNPLVIDADGRWLIGPDNGLFSWVFATAHAYSAHRIRPSVRRAEAVGSTFHGRDVFAHVAGLLAMGTPLGKIAGKKINPLRFKWPRPKYGRGWIRGEVVHIDRFGNVISNIPTDRIKTALKDAVVRCGALAVRGVSRSYAAVGAGQAVALCGSAGLLELSINRGSVAGSHQIAPGDAVLVRWQAKLRKNTG